MAAGPPGDRGPFFARQKRLDPHQPFDPERATRYQSAERRIAMTNAIVLMHVQPTAINVVAQKLVAIEGISEVHSVGGRYDLVAIIRARDNDDLATIVTEKMLLVQGITGTETLISYRVISSYDLESTFSLGSERP
jgi:DNA-binding Lrp family transcriptional regulator